MKAAYPKWREENHRHVEERSNEFYHHARWLVVWITHHHPNLDVTPIQKITDAVREWEEAGDVYMGPRSKMGPTLESARTVIWTVSQGIKDENGVATWKKMGAELAGPTPEQWDAMVNAHLQEHYYPTPEGQKEKAAIENLKAEAGNKLRYWFRSTGNTWDVRFGDEAGNFTDQKGFGIIARLLRFPNPTKLLSAMELIGRDVEQHGTFTEQEVTDGEALAAAKTWLNDEYPKELEAAREDGDPEKLAEVEERKKKAEKYISEAKGLGNKRRSIGPKSPKESARTSCRAAINRTIKALREAEKSLPKLAEHLERTILGEGTDFAYRTDGPPNWEL
jgi:hypothetical protein